MSRSLCQVEADKRRLISFFIFSFSTPFIFSAKAIHYFYPKNFLNLPAFNRLSAFFAE
jgi:hypothetical protein